MKVVTQKICLRNTTIPIIHAKERNLPLFGTAFGEIGDDAYAVLVVVE